MRAKIVISPKAAEKYVTPAYRTWGGGGGEDTKYSKSELQSSIQGGSFGNCRLSSYQVISKEKLVNILNIIKGEMYQTIPGI